MPVEKKEPPTPGVKDSNIDNPNIQNINDIDYLKEQILSSPLGKEIAGKTKEKSIFNTRSLNQFIQDVKNEPRPKKLIGDLVYEKELTILFAPTGLGKSILAIQMALSSSKGEYLNLGNDIVLQNEVGPIKTIFFDFELSNSQLMKRMGDITALDNLFISKVSRGQVLDGKPKEIFKLIKNEAESVWAKFIIIDNISKIGNKLEETDKATEFMKALADLVRDDGYTILIISHTPKQTKTYPITSDSVSGSNKIASLADAIIGINEVNSEEGNKVYIKQVKTRNEALIFGKSRVICTEIIKDENGFVRHECYTTCSEKIALSGGIINDESFNKKMFAAANYFFFGSYGKTNVQTNIPPSTLKQRVNSLRDNYPELYDKLKKMNKNELNEEIIMYSNEDTK